MIQIHISKFIVSLAFAFCVTLSSLSLVCLLTVDSLPVATLACVQAIIFAVFAVYLWIQLISGMERFETNRSYQFRRAGVISINDKRVKLTKSDVAPLPITEKKLIPDLVHSLAYSLSIVILYLATFAA